MSSNSTLVGFFGTFIRFIRIINQTINLSAIKMKRLFKCITLLFLCYYTGIAQESPKKHIVSSGETLLSISKKYNVTPYDLQKANPGAIQGIKKDDVIIIPESNIKTPILESAADSIKSSVTNSSISHTVKTGETKFGISKRYGLTTGQLESQNPQIISGLQVGQVLEIYPSSKVEQESSTATQENSAVTSAPPDRNVKKGKKHIVQGGETLVRLSWANGLTVDELVKANSKTISGELKIGQVLWIPGTNEYTISGDRIAYVVQSGDTKFSLSRRFNTSIRELERQNPQIISMLQVGQTITMPSDETSQTTPQQAQTENSSTPPVAPIEVVAIEEEIVVVTEASSEEITQEETIEETIVVTEVLSEETTQEEKKEEFVATNTPPEKAIEETRIEDAADTKENDFLMYQIQPKETVYGLAQKASMSVADFLVLNPELKESVQSGTVIKMPKSVQVSNSISNTEAVSNVPKITSGYADLKTSADLSKSKELLFFLPFSEMDYQNLATTEDNFKNVSDDFKRIHLEFYKGAHIAIDSIRKMQLNLNVDVVEAQSANQTSKTKSLIQENVIKKYDAIILPFYNTLEEDVAAVTADSKTPVITASTTAYQNNTNNLYSALPSINQQRLKVLNYMMSKQAHIIVLSDVNRVESKNFITDYVPNADFINIKNNGSFSEAELVSKLKKGQLNYVVIDSDRNSVFLNATTTLMSQLSNFSLQLAVLESSLIPDDSDVSQKRYRILKMIFPSLIPAKSTASSKQFLSDYQKKYNLLPSANIMIGFDITFDSLLRLVQQQSFEDSATNYITEYTQLKFDYKKNTLGGYSNEGIYILQYDSDANIRDAN